MNCTVVYGGLENNFSIAARMYFFNHAQASIAYSQPQLQINFVRTLPSRKTITLPQIAVKRLSSLNSMHNY